MIADGFRQHVLVGMRILHDRGGMNAGLGHEGAFADVRRMAVRRAVEHVVQRARHLHQRRHLLRGDADLERVGEFVLQAQRRDQRTEIGVAAALAEPVQRALDLPRTGAHRGQRIGDRLLGIVMGVDADMAARDMFCHVADDGFDLVRHGAAIGVAQHHPARAGIHRPPSRRPARNRRSPCSRRRSARNRPSPRGPRPLPQSTLSRIEARFSSLVVSSATRT